MASAQEVGDALLLLAGQFHSEGSIKPAIHCLEAIAQSPQALYPLTESHARRQLATLLLAHTNNVMEAKAHLEKAQLLLASIHGNWDLKLGITSDLGRCHKLLGNVTLQKQMYENGLHECRAAAASCPDANSWEVHFLLRLADSLVTTGESAQALSLVREGLGQAATRHTDPRVQILCQLFVMQLQLVDWAENSEAEQTLLDASRVFSSLSEERHSERLTLQLKLHFHILRVLFLLRLGQNAELATTAQGGEGRSAWMPAVVETMEELMELLGGNSGTSAGSAWEYEWMPLATVTSMVHLLCGYILKPTCKLKHVFAHLQKCRSVAESELSNLGVDFSPAEAGASRELQLPHHAIWDSRLLLVLRFLALESMAHISITMVDLTSAQELIRECMDLVSSFPMLLQQLMPSMHQLAGVYCHSMAAFSEAAACFAASRAEAPSVQWANLAACHAALSWLAADEPGLARDALGDLGDRACRAVNEGDADDEHMTLQEKALALLTAGLLMKKQGAMIDARTLLSQALRISHGPLSNQQLVSQILNALGPISMETGDLNGAEQMLKSSFQIAKGIYDSPAMVVSLNGMKTLLLNSGQASQAAENHDYTHRKAAEVNQAYATAIAKPDHANILKYANSLSAGPSAV